MVLWTGLTSWSVHQRVPATALPPRPGDRVPGRPGTSRFPCRWFPDTHEVSDRAGPACTSPWRCPPCCFPLFSTASAPWSFNFSRLNTQLASAPVNASPAPSRVTTHDSGSSWAANPSTYGSFIHYHLPASRRTESVRSRFPILRHLPGSEPLSTGETAWKTSSFPGVCEAHSGLRERNERPNLSPNDAFSPRPGAMGVSGPSFITLK